MENVVVFTANIDIGRYTFEDNLTQEKKFNNFIYVGKFKKISAGQVTEIHFQLLNPQGGESFQMKAYYQDLSCTRNEACIKFTDPLSATYKFECTVFPKINKYFKGPKPTPFLLKAIKYYEQKPDQQMTFECDEYEFTVIFTSSIKTLTNSFRLRFLLCAFTHLLLIL